MQTVPLQLSDVIYNAATQSFEALVTVHDAGQARSYACAIDAPITMEFADAASGLATQAMRRAARRAEALGDGWAEETGNWRDEREHSRWPPCLSDP